MHWKLTRITAISVPVVALSERERGERGKGGEKLGLSSEARLERALIFLCCVVLQ